MAFARVVVDVPTREIDAPFDYSVPAHLQPDVGVGVPVLVPFSGRPAVGWVVAMRERAEVARVKPIEQVLGVAAFDQRAADLALWIAEEYAASPAEAIRLFLPPGTSPRAERTVDVEGQVAWRLVGPANRPRAERIVELVPGSSYEPASGARLQRAVLHALSDGPLTTSELAAEIGGVSQALRRLEELGAVTITERRAFRAPRVRDRATAEGRSLSVGQQKALEACVRVAGHGGTVLLDGVTGSGKTEVYLRAIEHVLEEGGGAIVLVPEISLTPQTVGRFRSRFGDAVAVLHSRMSAGERLDEWDRARCGDARVVVGARSALFAPVADVRLVVIDEEHETSYKHGSSPRYRARDVARKLCATRGAGLVLGSATPSFESLSAAEDGRLERVVLPERVGGGAVPAVTLVDMAMEFNAGHRSMFSRELQTRLHQVARDGAKAVLLMNRRGFASFLLCRECSHVPTCDSCSTSMTYHEEGRFLACHHCGARRPVPPVCPSCGSVYLRQFGAGTQRVVSELEALLPDLPVVRMDADTTTGRGGHERCLAEFEDLASGVLVGTQMVAKGLDYPDVTLVGVLSADTTLHLPDFRSAERTWQLLCQVAGRAGRGPRGGSVVVQTYWPDHPAIRAVATGMRDAFVGEEWDLRRGLGYPPFGRLVNVVVASAEERAAKSHADRIATELRDRVGPGTAVLGPSPAPIAKMKRSYRWHVLLKAPADSTPSRTVREAVSAARGSGPKPTVSIDVDPVDLL